MAPVGTILCIGMLSLAAVILCVATVASAFVVIPLDDTPSTAVQVALSGPLYTSSRQYTTAV